LQAVHEVAAAEVPPGIQVHRTNPLPEVKEAAEQVLDRPLLMVYLHRDQITDQVEAAEILTHRKAVVDHPD
jgi:phosphoribosylanthranilate isomerase